MAEKLEEVSRAARFRLHVQGRTIGEKSYRLEEKLEERSWKLVRRPAAPDRTTCDWGNRLLSRAARFRLHEEGRMIGANKARLLAHARVRLARLGSWELPGRRSVDPGMARVRSADFQ